MTSIINKDPKVVVQGITGREGTLHTALMLRYGTRIVAGVTPGKGGQQVQNVPVYNRVFEAVNNHNADTSIIFVPAPFTRDAVLNAIDAGIKTVVVITEGIPQKDTIEFIAKANKNGDVTIVGPNTPGFISPPHSVKVGIMPAHVFKPGIVGIASRSGTLTYEIAWHVTNAGLGQSMCVGIGGDPIVGLGFTQLLEMFKDDEATKGVVLIGEIGGNAEELAAGYIKQTNYPKPVVAYIAGRLAPPEKRMGHAGAIVMGNVGTAKSKIDTFTAAGVPVAAKPSDIAKLLNL
ncbi:MAG TPA: succinate--CoA ligase subunit alpha [Dehalococcoidia bacterium]|nr:succinate--CoA ligase subunit alpha [Dehalococcoidia bacterium]